MINQIIHNLFRLLDVEIYAFDLIDANLQGCGASAQHDVLAVCCQLVHGQVYDGAIIYTRYVIMYSHFSCSLFSSEYR